MATTWVAVRLDTIDDELFMVKDSKMAVNKDLVLNALRTLQLPEDDGNLVDAGPGDIEFEGAEVYVGLKLDAQTERVISSRTKW